MRNLLRLLASACLIAGLNATALQPGSEYVEGEVLVTFKESVSLDAANATLKVHQLKFAKHFDLLSNHRRKHSGLVRAAPRTTLGLIAELQNDPSVEVVEPNFVRRPFGGAPNDPLYPQLWGLSNTGQSVNGFSGMPGRDIKFNRAWQLARPSTNEVVVAVIDTGVDYDHPDLAGSMWTNSGEVPNNSTDDDGNGYTDDYYGYDFGNGDSNPMDGSLHGTHVAGTIAATGNNQLGVIGVDYQAKIMALKVGTDVDPNSFSDATIIEAISYTVMMKGRGVNIVAINASFGGPDFDGVMEAAIQAAGDAGIIFCAAAGNSTGNNDLVPTYPASFRLTNMIVVAATDQNDNLAAFSNYGANTVDLAAPGVNIFSTTPTNLPGKTAFAQRDTTIYTANPLDYAGTTTGITAIIYDCGLGYPEDFPAAVSNNIAFISRGTLFFSDKVSNAMAAGARAAIIYNNVNGNFSGTLSSSSDWIPAISISKADGLAIKPALPATGLVANFSDPSKVYQFLQGTSMATPHVVGAIAFAAMNFPNENVTERIQRILANVDSVPGLQGMLITGGRLNLQRTVDTDSNGLPDWWEKIYFGHLTGTPPEADLDGDGASNISEWLAGTDPSSAASCFHILDAVRTGNDIRVSWSTVGGHSYVLRFATNAISDPALNFLDLSTVIPVSGTSEGTTNYLHLGGATNSAGYYRVRQD